MFGIYLGFINTTYVCVRQRASLFPTDHFIRKMVSKGKGSNRRSKTLRGIQRNGIDREIQDTAVNTSTIVRFSVDLVANRWHFSLNLLLDNYDTLFEKIVIESSSYYLNLFCTLMRRMNLFIYLSLLDLKIVDLFGAFVNRFILIERCQIQESFVSRVSVD